MDLRDEVMGTEGNIWLNSFLRTGFEMFSTGKGGYVAEKTEVSTGWLFPVGDEAHELGYPNMFSDMFESMENNRDPQETFYDGYIVNTILDAAFLSAKSGRWEPVQIENWRGNQGVAEKTSYTSFDEDFYLVKEEVLPNGDVKVILKNKASGAVVQQTKTVAGG
jgi:hypothetical protein